jgi:hypothetical protein
MRGTTSSPSNVTPALASVGAGFNFLNTIKFNNMIILSENLSKSEIQAAATKVINAVLDGNANPIDVYVRLKAVEAACKQALKGVEEEAITESYKHSGKSFTFLGATIQKKEGSLLLDYETDPVYVKLKEKVKEREEQLKTAYSMDKKGDIYVTGDGEQVPVVPPKPTKGTLAVTFKAE